MQASIQLGLNLPASGIRLYGPLQLSLIKRIIRRGTNVSVTGFLEMIQTQLPVMSLTAAGALGSVGLFARTLSLMQLPLQMVTTGATKVLYTTFVAVRAESAKLERGVRSLVELTSGMVVPICAGVIFARHDVIAVVLGPRWTDANPLVPLVAVGAACSVLSHVLALVGEATLQLTARFWIQLGVTATTGAILFVLRNRGAEGAAVGFMAGSGLFLATQMALCASVLKLRPIKLLHWLAPSFAAAILVAIYIEATLVFGESWPAALRLVVEITGSSIALGLFYLWAVPGPIGRIVALSGIESAKLSWFARVNRAAVSSGG
ncbi:MAG: oligosaccharide flippase family protein [Caulobacteraceae bacterium]